MTMTATLKASEASHDVVFDGVSKHYQTAGDPTVIFDDVSLELPAGEFVSLVGSSGCGKTTLLSMAAGFTVPDAGEVRVGGRRVAGPGRERGVVFQQYAVFPWMTVRKNIEFSLKLRAAGKPSRAQRADKVDHYLDVMGLARAADLFPKSLSGGMKQRVAIARAYAADPRILLMDEPFAALDAQSREAMQADLSRITREEGKTVLFITHSVEEAIFLSDQIVVMSGRPAVVAAPLKVVRDSGSHHDTESRLSTTFIEMRRQIEAMLSPEHGRRLA